MPMNFLKFNKMFFFQNYVFNYMIKKIDDYIIEFNKKKYPAKPANRDNQGYLTKLANWVIYSRRLNKLVFIKIIFFILINFFKK
jgi:hypothetical protein